MKTTLITGANGGIGLAMTQRLLSDGHRVVAHFRNSNFVLDQLSNPNLFQIQGDFSTKSGVTLFLAKLLKLGHPIDVLINNAGGVGEAQPFLEISEENLDAVLQLNFKAPLFLAQAVLPAMIENKWGRIINISSIGVKFGGAPTTAHYSMSKAALEALTCSLHKLAAPHNVLVNTVRVGVVQTKLQGTLKGKNMEERIDLIPLGRCGTPEEIANTVAFLASDQSSYVAGSTLLAAGGE